MSATSTPKSTSSRARGALSPDAANRLKALVSGSLDKAAFAKTDFVIEAVFENMDVKKKVFAELEQFIAPETILATNTSSLSITEMASGLEHPERVVGFHFFNPVAVLPLLEIIKGSKTDDATLATAFATAKSLKKSAVLCGDKAGFVFNRLVTRTLGEVMSAVDEGTPFDVADNAIAELGMPMSPFTLLALGRTRSGTAPKPGRPLQESYPDRFKSSPGLKATRSRPASPACGPGARTVRPSTPRSPHCGRRVTRCQLRKRSSSAHVVHLPRKFRSCSTRASVAAAEDIDPLPAARRRIRILERRHHAVPGPHRHPPRPSTASASSRLVLPASESVDRPVTDGVPSGTPSVAFCAGSE